MDVKKKKRIIANVLIGCIILILLTTGVVIKSNRDHISHHHTLTDPGY